MSLTPEDKKALINDIYSDFLEKVKEIELERDQRILNILKDSGKNSKD